MGGLGVRGRLGHQELAPVVAQLLDGFVDVGERLVATLLATPASTPGFQRFASSFSVETSTMR